MGREEVGRVAWKREDKLGKEARIKQKGRSAGARGRGQKRKGKGREDVLW